MTTTTNPTRAVISTLLTDLVSADYALAQAADRASGLVSQLSRQIKPMLEGVAFAAWETVRKDISSELCKKYEAKGANKESAQNNADKQWSRIIEKAGLTKPLAETKEAQTKAAQRSKIASTTEKAKEIAEGKTVSELFQMAEKAGDDDKAVLLKAAQIAVQDEAKAKQTAKTSLAKQAKADTLAALKNMGTGYNDADYTMSICRAMLVAASHADMVGAVATVADTIKAAQLTLGSKASPASVSDVLVAALAALAGKTGKPQATRATRAKRAA